MNCAGCDAELPAGSKFCPACGAKVLQVEEKITVETRLVIKEIMPILTAAQLAELLQVSRWSVYEMAKAGEIPALRIGSSGVRFRADQVLEALTRTGRFVKVG
jgi:excisionase family DNA binding protein